MCMGSSVSIEPSGNVKVAAVHASVSFSQNKALQTIESVRATETL